MFILYLYYIYNLFLAVWIIKRKIWARMKNKQRNTDEHKSLKPLLEKIIIKKIGKHTTTTTDKDLTYFHIQAVL